LDISAVVWQLRRGTAGSERQGDGRGETLSGNLGDEHCVVLPEGKSTSSAPVHQVFDGATHGANILRMGKQPRQSLGRVTDLM